MEELDLYNINEGSLFPELEHQLSYLEAVKESQNQSEVGLYEELSHSINNEDGVPYTEKGANQEIKEIKDKDSAITSIIKKHINDKKIGEEIYQIITSQTKYIDWFLKETNISEVKMKIKRFFIKQNMPKDLAESSANLIINEIVKLYKDEVVSM